jgi:hypothetical protein
VESTASAASPHLTTCSSSTVTMSCMLVTLLLVSSSLALLAIASGAAHGFQVF